MNSKLISILALAVYCLNLFLAVDALPAAREIHGFREAYDVVLADPSLEDRGNPFSNLAYILCVSECFQVCTTYHVSTIACYLENDQCFEHCSTLEYAVKARDDTDVLDSRVNSGPAVIPMLGLPPVKASKDGMGFVKVVPQPAPAIENGNSIVRRAEAKASLKQVASINATAGNDATSSSDVAAAAVVTSTVPSDIVPWNTAILRWNACESICFDFCYTVNIQDNNDCQNQYPQCFKACFAKFEQSIGIDIYAKPSNPSKRSISRVATLTPRVESTSGVWGPVQNAALVNCYKECLAEKDECQYSDAFCADSFNDCDDSCKSEHPMVKARDGLDAVPLAPRVESAADAIVGPVGFPDHQSVCVKGCQANDIQCELSDGFCADALEHCLESCNSKVKARDSIDAPLMLREVRTLDGREFEIQIREQIEYRDVDTGECHPACN